MKACTAARDVPEPIRRLRTRARFRRRLTQARAAEKQRVGKLPEDGHRKLSSVISHIHGVWGRDMLNALVAGQRDPKALAQLARGTMRGKIRRLEQALDCSFFTAEHAAVLAMMLTTIDHLHTRRQARNHIRSLERPGDNVTIQAINPDAGELPAPAARTATTVNPEPGSAKRAAGRCRLPT